MNSSMFQMQRGKQQSSLPLSHEQQQQGVGRLPAFRRRLSSLSLNLKIQPSSSSSWSLRRSKSVSQFAASSIGKWWQWGLGWILSRKPTFATDLEMNEEETAALGSHNKGSWSHVFFKLTSQLRRKLGGPSHNIGLPQTFRYDSFNKNFDDASRRTTLY